MAKFINTAKKGEQLHLLNVDHIARIYPGCTGELGPYGKDETCTVVLNFAIQYDYGTEYKVDLRSEEYEVQLLMPVKELVRRMREETLNL